MLDKRQEYFEKQKEKDAVRRDRLRLLAGVFEFISAAIGILILFALIIALFSLVNWLINDIWNNFSMVLSFFQE